jgi:anti-sigma B factor antagonist
MEAAGSILAGGRGGWIPDEFRLRRVNSMGIQVTTRQVGDVSVVDVVGRITLGEGGSTLREIIQDLVSKGNKKVLLNLGEVSYIDSSGIGELVSAFTTVTNRGGVMKLLNLTKRVQGLLQITKLYTVFEVFDSEISAMHSFA